MTTFADLKLDRFVVEGLRRMDVVEPTPIQEAAIPEILAGRDVVGQARTGSGKTLAFGLPLLSLCDPSIASPQALVLVPTRELAGQVSRVIDKLAPQTNLRAAQIYGGRDMSDQLMLLNTGPQIIIGTPGRIIDHLYRGTLSFRHLRIVVLDEADQMLDQGFADDVERILDCMTGKVQMALFSATVPGWVDAVISHRLDDPAYIKVDEAQRGPNESIDHTVIEVAASRKLEALRALLDERDGGSVLVFARTKIGVEKLGNQLGALGYKVGAMQGNLNQSARERVLRGFRRGNPDILIATNVAARGLDILSIQQVINYDVPESAELLTHRLGRTGRMGRHGTAITLLTPTEGRKWQVIERQIGVRVSRERWTGTAFEQIGTDVQHAKPTQGDDVSAEAEAGRTRTRQTSTPKEAAVRQNGASTRRSPERPKHETTCAACGKSTTVRFTPRGDRPIYCNTCFKERKATTAA